MEIAMSEFETKLIEQLETLNKNLSISIPDQDTKTNLNFGETFVMLKKAITKLGEEITRLKNVLDRKTV
jgi:hypothetical protein